MLKKRISIDGLGGKFGMRFLNYYQNIKMQLPIS